MGTERDHMLVFPGRSIKLFIDAGITKSYRSFDLHIGTPKIGALNGVNLLPNVVGTPRVLRTIFLW